MSDKIIPDSSDTCPIVPESYEPEAKLVNLALQGGGAHGAFTWGVLDKILEDGRIRPEGLSGTSAGSMNAVVFAYGNLMGGRNGARQALHNFWRDISIAGSMYSPIKRLPWEYFINQWNMDTSYTYNLFDFFTRLFSPYQFNPFNFNPLRDVLAKSVDFDTLCECQVTRLFISATAVRTGRVRVFTTKEVSLEVILASACLPFLFQAVKINGEHYWDGGYMGNPALYPLIYHTKSNDVLIVHINPMVREELPTSSADIMNRVNEITFNSSLLREMRAIAFVTKLIDEDWLKPEHKDNLKRLFMHSIRADDALSHLSVASKFNTEWQFLCYLRDLGRQAAADWLAQNFDHIGQQSSVDLRAEFLEVGQHHISQ